MGILLIHLGSVAVLAVAVALALLAGELSARHMPCALAGGPPETAAPAAGRVPLGGALWESMDLNGRKQRAIRCGDAEPRPRCARIHGRGAVASLARRMHRPRRAGAGRPMVLGNAGGPLPAGGVCVLWRIGWQVRRVRREVADGTPPPPWFEDRLASAGAALGVAPPRAVGRRVRAACIQIAGAPVLVVSATPCGRSVRTRGTPF